VDQRKTGKRLLIAWSADLRAAVESARALHGDHRRLWLLAQRNGRPRSYYGVRDLWDRACERAGVTDARLHDLRAKALTDAKRQGHDAQALAGHATEATTVRYLRGRERDVVEGPALRIVETKV
jgi:integrase